MTATVTYDGFDLTAGLYRVTALDPMSSPKKMTELLQLARKHGSLRVFESYESKTIMVAGYINATSSAELEGAIDTLKSFMRRESGDLEYDWDGGVRIHNCTATDVNISRDQTNISFVPYAISFECESPFAKDGVTDTWMAATAITTAILDTAITANGTMDSQPTITITVGAINPTVSDVTMTISNEANSQNLAITATFVAGDVITIDCTNYRVFKNGALIKTSGQFPYWAVGAGVLHYEDTATTRTLAVTTTSERLYL